MEDEPRAAQAPQPQENGVGEGDRPRASRLAAGHDSHNAQPAQGASEGIPEAAAHASAPAGAHVTGAHATAPTDSPAVTSGPSLDADTAPQSPDGLAPQGHGHAQQDASPAPTPPRPTSSSSTAPTGTGPGAGTGSAAAAAPPAVTAAGFVAPHSYLRPVGGPQRPPLSRHNTSSAMQRQRDNQVEIDQTEGLRAIRAFLKVRTTYDVLPLSYRLIVLDTALLVKKSLNILIQCGIVSAPLWDSKTSTYAGLLTTSDYLNVVQYYWQNPDALARIDQFRLNSLRDIERALGVSPLETVSIHPLRTLYEACRKMLESRARRIPLVDVDDETQREMVVSVLTQYRILKFVSVNVTQTQMLRKPLYDLKVGTYNNLATAAMDTPVMEVIHQLVKRSISTVPILDKDGTVLNLFEAVDVIALIKGGDYDNLQLTVGKALEKRSEDFPGIYTCTLNDRLDTIFETIRKSRVHRLVVVDESSQLVGLLSLSDILDYTLNSPLPDGGEH